MGTSWWKAQNSKDVLEKKRKEWSSMEAGDAEREFYWWLAGATFLQLGTWTAGFSYAEILWMQQEHPSRLECSGESILQETYDKYSLILNPGELLAAAGSKRGAVSYIEAFHRKLILDNFCVVREVEGFPLRATIEELIEL